MLTIIEGLTGSGKTYFQTKLLRKEWKQNFSIHANFRLLFSEENEDIYRFHNIDETYHIKKGVLGIDEAQDLAGHWVAIPVSFRNKIAHHRHQEIDIYATTQSFMDLHVELRRNTHEIYRCQSILRIPRKDNIKPFLQIIKVIKKKRIIKGDNENIRFAKVGRSKHLYISRLWTKKYYDTFANIDFDKYSCKLICETKSKTKRPEWILKIYNRDMVNNGKARL